MAVKIERPTIPYTQPVFVARRPHHIYILISLRPINKHLKVWLDGSGGKHTSTVVAVPKIHGWMLVEHKNTLC